MTDLTRSLLSSAVHDAQAMRAAGADWLSLALMDARTRTLGWLSVFEGVPIGGPLPLLDPPLWVIGQAAWFQEYWIARHVQRGRGATADPRGPRLASLDPAADGWYDPQAATPAERWSLALPEAEALRGYLQATLDTTLELLDKAGDSPAALHVFQLALHHEDLAGEALAVLAQALDLPPERQAQAESLGLTRPWRSLARRDAIGLPGQRVVLGCGVGAGGDGAADVPTTSPAWAPAAEQGQLSVSVPEFEIDAQPVCWAQWLEFIDDGGYDERRWWSPAGQDWLEAGTRRAPRYVEQLNGGVLARRQGRLQRLPAQQPVLHLTHYEAEAWCQWAGRRLPSEAEWQLAAQQAAGRGFVWGEVLEWVAGTARAYPGAPAPAPAGLRVLRGATGQASARLAHVAARRYVPPEADALFCGFRSCAL